MDNDGRSGVTRRDFLRSASAAAATAALAERVVAQAMSVNDKGGQRPIIVSSANGLPALDKAMAMLREGHDPLDAVIAAVNVVEDDPNDQSVGLGGMPNEDGVVELDASVMHGPTHKAGAVAALRNIRNPSKVARLVMERTDHVLLVGAGALRFARAHGFVEEDLLTEASRKKWLEWKESLSDEDDWLAPPKESGDRRGARARAPRVRQWGTINCCAVTADGDLAGVTTTSGLAYKIPGRVGDSPIIGAGLYVDNEVGAAGSTGRGESNLINCSSFLVVEFMRHGLDPERACMEVLKRVADRTEPRLRDKAGRADFDLKFYAVAKDGRFGGGAMWSGGKYAVCDGAGARKLDLPYLYKREEKA